MPEQNTPPAKTPQAKPEKRFTTFHYITLAIAIGGFIYIAFPLVKPKLLWMQFYWCGIECQEITLTDTSLRGMSLQGVDMSRADIRRVNMQDADLSGANLTAAILSGADLRRTNLSGVNLSKTRLDGTIIDETTIIDDKLACPSYPTGALSFASNEQEK